MDYLDQKRALQQQGLTGFQAHVKALELTKITEEKPMATIDAFTLKDAVPAFAYYCKHHFLGGNADFHFWENFPTAETELDRLIADELDNQEFMRAHSENYYEQSDWSRSHAIVAVAEFLKPSHKA